MMFFLGCGGDAVKKDDGKKAPAKKADDKKADDKKADDKKADDPAPAKTDTKAEAEEKK